MTVSSMYGNHSNDGKEEPNYPASPRSQKWITNLLPVLEHYNYNYNDIVQLVKACDYNCEKIQDEVDRIMQMNIGHEQGEWTVVKQPERTKQPVVAKATKTQKAGSRKESQKETIPREPKQKRIAVTVKGSLRQQPNKENLTTATVEPAQKEKVNQQPSTEAPLPVTKELQKPARGKPSSRNERDAHKPTSSKDSSTEAPKQSQQPAAKKGFPMQWASLLKTVTAEEDEGDKAAPSEPHNTAEGPAEKTVPTANAAKKEEKGRASTAKGGSPKGRNKSKAKVQNDMDAIALAKAQEALKKLELVVGEKVEKKSRAQSPLQSPVPVAVVEESIPVVMPKPLSAGIDATVLFGCFEEEAQKPTDTWTQTSSLGGYNQPHSQTRREYGKCSRTTHDLRNENGVTHNLLQHETETSLHHDVGSMHHEQTGTLHVDNSHMQENMHEAGFPAQWQMGYYGNRYSNTKQQPFSYAYEEDKHKAYRQGGNEHYGQKDNRHHMNGVYFNYGYQPERLQSPPGLVGYYTTQQPYYGFPNSTNQSNPTGASDSMASMWRS